MLTNFAHHKVISRRHLNQALRAEAKALAGPIGRITSQDYQLAQDRIVKHLAAAGYRPDKTGRAVRRYPINHHPKPTRRIADEAQSQ